MADRDVFIAQGASKPDNPHNKFDRSKGNDLTCQFGKIYPIYSKLYPAGSRIKIRPHYGFDLMPMVFPVQTNIRMHLKYYSVPLRILWKNWKNYVSMQGRGYIEPFISRQDAFHETGSLSDYMGLPSFVTQNIQKTAFYPSTKTFHAPVMSSPINSRGVDFHNDFLNTITLASTSSYRTINDVTFHTSQLIGYYHPSDRFHKDTILSMFTNGFTFQFISSVLVNGTFSVRLSLFNAANDMVITYTPTITISNNSYHMVSIGSASYYVQDAVFSASSSVVSSLDIVNGFDRDDGYYFLIQHAESSLGCPASYPSTNLSDLLLTTISSGGNVVSKDDDTSYVPDNVPLCGFIGTYQVYNESVSAASPKHFRVQPGVNGGKPWIPILAYRWRAYEFIFNYFMRNERVTPFMLPDSNNQLQIVYNQFLTNDGDGADSTTPLSFKYAPFEYDMFTTCVPSPQFGDAPLVGVSFTHQDNEGTFTIVNNNDVSSMSIGVSINDDGAITGITNYDTDANNPRLTNLQKIIDFGISISDLRNVSAYQRMLERYQKAGTKYQNIIYEFFGTNPPIGEEFPRYIGGKTDSINVNKIQNTSGSNDSQYRLGEFAGVGSLRQDKSFEIDTYTTEDTIVMGILWFSVTPTYSQALDKELTYNSLLDYYNPQFANISPQPVYDYQINPLGIDIDNGTEDEIRARLSHVFGYNRPWVELVSDIDEVHGLFRSNLRNFVMQRIFDGVPALGSDFLYIHPDDFTDIFSVTQTTDKIFGKIYHDVEATLPVPRFSIGKIL